MFNCSPAVPGSIKHRGNAHEDTAQAGPQVRWGPAMWTSTSQWESHRLFFLQCVYEHRDNRSKRIWVNHHNSLTLLSCGHKKGWFPLHKPWLEWGHSEVVVIYSDYNVPMNIGIIGTLEWNRHRNQQCFCCASNIGIDLTMEPVHYH